MAAAAASPWVEEEEDTEERFHRPVVARVGGQEGGEREAPACPSGRVQA